MRIRTQTPYSFLFKLSYPCILFYSCTSTKPCFHHITWPVLICTHQYITTSCNWSILDQGCISMSNGCSIYFRPLLLQQAYVSWPSCFPGIPRGHCPSTDRQICYSVIDQCPKIQTVCSVTCMCVITNMVVHKYI